MIEKEILWIDMDGVLANFEKGVEMKTVDPFIREFYKSSPDRIPGIFRDLPPIEGAVDAVYQLHESGKYDMYVATAAPWGNPEAATDKRYWIERHFGRMFRKKMAITHLKHLLVGDYLIDDRTANGAGEFGKITGNGKHIHFGTKEFPNWESVLNYLL